MLCRITICLNPPHGTWRALLFPSEHFHSVRSQRRRFLRFSSNLQGAEPSKPPRGLATSYAVCGPLCSVSQESSEGPRRPISPGCVPWKLDLPLAFRYEQERNIAKIMHEAATPRWTSRWHLPGVRSLGSREVHVSIELRQVMAGDSIGRRIMPQETTAERTDYSVVSVEAAPEQLKRRAHGRIRSHLCKRHIPLKL